LPIDSALAPNGVRKEEKGEKNALRIKKEAKVLQVLKKAVSLHRI